MSKGESSFFSSMSVEQKQEYFAAKETKMENVKDMLSGFKDAIDNMKPEDLQSYMDSVVNLYEYSPGNQWLIYFQLLNVLNKEELAGTKPGEVSMFNLKQPSSFASMTAWNDLGRKIVKGSRGADVLVPVSISKARFYLNEKMEDILKEKGYGSLGRFLGISGFITAKDVVPTKTNGKMIMTSKVEMPLSVKNEILSAQTAPYKEKMEVFRKYGLDSSAEVSDSGDNSVSIIISGLDFKVRSGAVFDLSQTEEMIDSDGKSIAKPLNEKTFSSDIGFSESVAIIKNVFGINVVREDMAIEKGGYVLLGDDSTIHLNANLNELQNIGTLYHELSHILLGHTKIKEEGAKTSDDISRGEKETEAETLAYLFSKFLGIERKHEAYVKLWFESIKIPEGKQRSDVWQDSMKKVSKTYSESAKKIKEHLLPSQKEGEEGSENSGEKKVWKKKWSGGGKSWAKSKKKQ